MLVVGIISLLYGIQSLYERNTLDYITIVYLALAVGYFMHGESQ